MKECNAGRSEFWADAAEWPGFSIVEVFFIHKLCTRRKILAVLHMSSAPRRGGHLVGSEQIWRRAPCGKTYDIASKLLSTATSQRYRLHSFASCGAIFSSSSHLDNKPQGPQVTPSSRKNWRIVQLNRSKIRTTDTPQCRVPVWWDHVNGLRTANHSDNYCTALKRNMGRSAHGNLVQWVNLQK